MDGISPSFGGIVITIPSIFILDLDCIMAFQLALLNGLIFIVRQLRTVIVWIGLVQRHLDLGFFVVIIGRLLFSFFGWHRPYVYGLKVVLRVAFFLRGIRVVVHPIKETPLTQMTGIHLVNHGDPLALWLLFAYLPYDHLVIANDELFDSSFFNSYLFLLGFMPQEHGIRPDNMASFDSRLAPYINQQFSFWQMVYFEYRDMDSLPYSIIMGLKFNIPLHLWQFKG